MIIINLYWAIQDLWPSQSAWIIELNELLIFSKKKKLNLN